MHYDPGISAVKSDIWCFGNAMTAQVQRCKAALVCYVKQIVMNKLLEILEEALAIKKAMTYS